MISSLTESLPAPRRSMRLAAALVTLALVALVLLAAEGSMRIRQTLK